MKLNVRDRIPERQRKNALARLQQLSHGVTLKPYLTQRLTEGGRVLEVAMICTALINEAGQVYAVATTERLSGLEGAGS